MLGLGPVEIGIVAVVGVLLFGHKLPSVANSIGRSFVEFKKGLTDVKEEVNNVKEEVKSELKELK